MAMSYDGKIELYKGPNTNAIKPIGAGDRYFGTNPNATQFDNSTVADCFQFMVNKAKEKGCKVDVYCPDLMKKLNRTGTNRFTAEELSGFDFTEYTMSFRKGYGYFLQIVKNDNNDRVQAEVL